MEQKSIYEYHCTECNSIVSESDQVCPTCGTDLTEIVIENKKPGIIDKILLWINKFSGYHRINCYLFLSPVLIFMTSIIGAIIYIFYSFLIQDTVGKFGTAYVFNYFVYLYVAIQYTIPVFVFVHLYLKIDLKIKLVITVSVVVVSYLVSLLFPIFGLDTLGILPITLIMLEGCFIKYAKKDYTLLVIGIILLLGWLQFLSLGNLPKEMVKNDYHRVIKPLQVLKSEVHLISWTKELNKYDEVIPYVLYRKQDTLQLLLKYNKVWTKNIPSQKWQLENWTIDSLFSETYYYKKNK